jgi:uncharacterized protein (DUF1015 family)
MPRFEPFAALRYASSVDLDAVTAPPYDVIDAAERDALAARSDHNVVHLDAPVGGDDRYREASARLEAWQADGTLVADGRPTLTVYRMRYTDEQGRPRSTVGVFGALGLEEPGTGDVLPHEHTTPKARSDRLDLLRTTGHNLSSIWVLSLAAGLTARCPTDGPPSASCTDELGVVHECWVVDDAAAIAAITETVASAPVVIADGHHRYETSLAHRDEVRAANGDRPGPADLTLALVVELTEDELAVRPIHRLVHDLPAGTDLPAALGSHFDVSPTDPADARITERMATAGALALVLPDGGTWLLRPRPDAFPADLPDLDSSRLDVAREALGGATFSYQHGVDNVVRAVASGGAGAGVLLRPATVAQIARTAHARGRMPPKTTYFHPKIRTGLLFRPAR